MLFLSPGEVMKGGERMETIDNKTEVRRVERNEFYQKFCDSVVNRLKEEGYEVSGEVKEVTKNNGVVYNGIQFQGEGNVQPVIYMDSYYDAVEHGAMTFDQAVERAATTYQEGQIDAGFQLENITDYDVEGENHVRKESHGNRALHLSHR